MPSRNPPAALNYIRNAVKVVIDAYNGTVDFYVSDPADPIIQTYQRIFPGLFKPLAAMPADLQQHIRYPEDLFLVQAQLYRTYHMDSAGGFLQSRGSLAVPARARPASTALMGRDTQRWRPTT